jgi:predicted AAA+ superfamily ATPase
MANFESSTFKRYKYLELKEKINNQQSFLLFGPRQTGKSTLLEKLFKELPDNQKLAFYLQLPSQRQLLETDPESLKRQVEAFPLKPVYVLIDEIQKCPQVTDVLQYLIDHKQIVLMASGSSSRKMRTLSQNWLPGRIHLEYLYPLTWEESTLKQNPQRLKQHLLYGFLPAICAESDLRLKQESLTSYSHLYLEEEIRAEALVRKLQPFSKFLKLAALESGTSPNLSKISQQIGVSGPSIREYYQILEDTLMIEVLSPYAPTRGKINHRNKYYFFDMGVRNAASSIGHSEGLLALQMGILFEHFIVLEVIATLKKKFQLSYWSDGKSEVDLIIDNGSQLFAIEIKSTDIPKAEHFKGIKKFSHKYKVAQKIVVCQCSVAQKFEEGLALPWYELTDYIQSLTI